GCLGDRCDLPRPGNAAGFHDLDTHEVGEFAAYHVDRLGWCEDALIRHGRRVDGLGDGSHCGALLTLDRLFDERGAEGLDVLKVPNGIPGIETLIVIDTKIDTRRQVGTKALQAAQIILVLGEAGLDLENVDAARRQPFGKGEVLFEVGIGDRYAERHSGSVVAAEQLRHRNAQIFAGDVEQRHLDGGLCLGVADQRFLDLTHERRNLERVGADEERAQIVMNAGGIGLGGAGKDRPRGCLAPPDDVGVGADLDDSTGHRFLDIANAVPALHLQGPANHIDRNAGNAQLAHRCPHFPSTAAALHAWTLTCPSRSIQSSSCERRSRIGASVSNNARKTVVVIGAGMVGVTTASFLLRKGHDVGLLDPNAPGEGASFGNAGCFNGSSVVPMSMPGTVGNVPGWLTDPLGPLVVRWSYLPTLVPWLVRFIAAGSEAKVAHQARALRTLLVEGIETLAPLVHDAGAQDLVQRQGHLFVYRSLGSWEKEKLAWRLRREN